MRWYHYLALFFAGAFLANSVPHFVQGISGRSFPSSFNLVAGYALCRVGDFSIRRTRDAAIVGVGVILMAVTLANAFGPLYANR